MHLVQIAQNTDSAMTALQALKIVNSSEPVFKPYDAIIESCLFKYYRFVDLNRLLIKSNTTTI
jgi:hypothetical protein